MKDLRTAEKKSLYPVIRFCFILTGFLCAGLAGLPGAGWVRQAEAAVTYVASGTDCSATTEAITIPKPAGTTTGDVMIMVLNTKDGAAQTPLAGWTQIGSSLVQGTTVITSVYYRVATASEPATYDPVMSAVSKCGGIATFRGVDTVNPINAYSALADTGADTINNAAEVSPLLPNTMIVFIIGDAQEGTHASWSGTNPTFTENIDAMTAGGTDNSIAMAYGLKTDSGTTGARTAASTLAAVSNSFLLALKPTLISTTPGAASSTMVSSTSISVVMPYTDDTDGDNTYTVDYRLSKNTAWTNKVTNATHTASPYQVAITGLTTGEIYDVRMIYNDPDGITTGSTGTIIAGNIVVGASTKTTAGKATIRVMVNGVNNTGEVLVRMPFDNDTNNSSQYGVRYKKSSDGLWTQWSTTASYAPAHIYKTKITGLELDTSYDFQLTYGDADGVLGYGSPQTYTNVMVNPSMHNSTTTSMRKWSGNWGMPGGQYGDMVCTTCHERFPTNIKRIKSSGGISAPSTTTGEAPGNFPGSSVTPSFMDARSGTSQFGDDSTAPRSTSNKICEVCHSKTEYHKYNQPTTTGHFDKQDCIPCHSHASGFYPSGGQCTNCHGQPQNQLYNTRQVTGAGGDFVKLSRHVSNGTATEIVTSHDCVVCHREGDSEVVASGSGYLDLYNHKNGTSQTTRFIKLRNVDDRENGWDFSKYNTTATMRANLDTFCLNCHDSNGASQIAVVGPYTAPTLSLIPTAAAALSPFNDTDNFRNGRDGLTGRTRVLDVKTQFFAGSGGSGSGYNGNPSQHAVLGARYSTTDPGGGWVNTTWTSHTTRKGTVMSTGRETTTLHCSDCHLSETNAHGAANAWHMLQNGTVNDTTTDYAMGGVADSTAASIVCYKCHNSAVYGATATAGSRIEHASIDGNVWGQLYGGAKSSKLGPTCLLCHAGDGYGNIHGVSGQFTTASGTYSRYRFLNGGYMTYINGSSDSNSWTATTAATCYFTDTGFTNCGQHAGTKAGSTYNYGRAVKY